MSKPVRISEAHHESITAIAESSERSKQEVTNSLLEESLEELPEGEEPDQGVEADAAVGCCPYTGEVYTENDVKTDRTGEYVQSEVPNSIAVEDLEPVEEE